MRPGNRLTPAGAVGCLPYRAPSRRASRFRHKGGNHAQRFFNGDRTWPTYGFNGTTYIWNDVATPSSQSPFAKRPSVRISGLAIAAIPKPAEAPVVWDMPYWNPVGDPCTTMDLAPAHAKGLNVVYGDTHAKFSAFANHPTPGAVKPCLEDWWGDHNWEGYYE